MIIIKCVEAIEFVVKVASSVVNIFCVLIMVTYVISAILSLLSNKYSIAKNKLTIGINIALTFNLAGEVMKIIVSREMSELYMIGGILVLKVIIAFLLHYEEKWEKEENIVKSRKK